jgi:2-succinyl-5-enolpyruvyl-6-hydroxy-3-cyclohexene-1-carboxylate synthase
VQGKLDQSILNRPGVELARRNLEAALLLLKALMEQGLSQAVLCPGSRSGALALALGVLEPHGLALYTAIDERSAAFFALGLARATGKAVAVVTTSGTAVANLLPAAVEADYGAIPLLLISADRPSRLKGCGANQTVNQESFLAASVRWFGQGDGTGLAAMTDAAIAALARQAWSATRSPGLAPGPVHLNLPFAEPLHAGGPALLEATAYASLEIPPPPWGELGLRTLGSGTQAAPFRPARGGCGWSLARSAPALDWLCGGSPALAAADGLARAGRRP